ncbi:hypothetical protein MLD52_14395 [Puniceicoccaceae bacterium K14]|nr:hypothetical protein [Puniceicoccaceae bacterium K14]
MLLFAVGTLNSCLITNALPEYGAEIGGRCIACHGTPISEQSGKLSWGGIYDGMLVEGLMRIPGQDEQLDLGTQLDGNVLGVLEVLNVDPGATINLPVEVLDGEADHAVVLVGLEDGGQVNSRANKLEYSYVGDEYWTVQSTYISPTFDYIHSEVEDDKAAEIRYLPLEIDDSTAADVYLLTFGLARRSGVQLSYQEQSFYLRVLGEEESVLLAPNLKLLNDGGQYSLEFLVDDALAETSIHVQRSIDYLNWENVAVRENGLLNSSSSYVDELSEDQGIARIQLNEPATLSFAYRLAIQ